PIDDFDSCSSAAERICACIYRIHQKIHNRFVHRKLPFDRAPKFVIRQYGQGLSFTAIPEQHLARAAQLAKFREHTRDGLPNAEIWVHLDLAVMRPTVACRKRKTQLSASRLLTRGFQ